MSRALLDQGHTATDAAALAGFPSYERMRRVVARELSISPAPTSVGSAPLAAPARTSARARLRPDDG